VGWECDLGGGGSKQGKVAVTAAVFNYSISRGAGKCGCFVAILLLSHSHYRLIALLQQRHFREYLDTAQQQ